MNKFGLLTLGDEARRCEASGIEFIPNPRQGRAGLEAPERNALWALEGYLEKALVQPFSPD